MHGIVVVVVVVFLLLLFIYIYMLDIGVFRLKPTCVLYMLVNSWCKNFILPFCTTKNVFEYVCVCVCLSTTDVKKEEIRLVGGLLILHATLLLHA